MALKALIDLLIPPLCEGCEERLGTQEKRLCHVCLQDLASLPPFKSPTPLFDKLGAVWTYGGAAQRLITRYKEAKRELDAPLFANYILLQIDKLNWPAPEIIVTVPQDPFKKLWLQFDPIGLIGKEIAKSFSIPHFDGLKKQGGRPSQATLAKEERETLHEETFFLTNNEILGKRVLLLDDVMTTGSTLKAAASALWKGNPLSLYALALAKVE